MAIKIEWQVKPPSKGSDESKPQMFPRITDSEVVDGNRLAEMISKRSSLSRGSVIAALNDMADIMAELLREGRTIDIPSLGAFRLSIGTDAEILPDSKRRMYSVAVRGVNFQPDRELMNAIGKPHFTWKAGTGVAVAPTVAQMIPQLDEYFETHDSITRQEFERMFSLRRTTAYYRLKELVENGSMQAVGRGRDAKYVLMKKATQSKED